MRTVSFDVPPQEVLTKDSVTVAVDAVGNYAPNLLSLLFTANSNALSKPFLFSLLSSV